MKDKVIVNKQSPQTDIVMIAKFIRENKLTINIRRRPILPLCHSLNGELLCPTPPSK